MMEASHVKTRMCTFVVCGTLGLFLANLAAATGEQDFPAMFEELFGERAKRVATTPGRADDVEFAADLLKSADMLSDKPGLQAMLYEKACEYGMTDPQGHVSAIAAIRKLQKMCPRRNLDWQKSLLRVRQAQLGSADLLGRAAAAMRVMEELVRTGSTSAAAGESGPARGFFQRAKTLAEAQRLGGPLLEKIRHRLRACGAMVAAEADLKRLQLALKGAPDDAKARKALVELYVVSHDDPAEAAKWLSDSLDEALRKHVAQAGEAAEETDDAVCLELAGWYRELAGPAPPLARPLMLARAAAWYEAYLDRHPADGDAANVKGEIGKLWEQLGKMRHGAWRSAPPLPPPSLKLSVKAGEILVYTGHTSDIRDLAVSPDGSLVASCSKDGTIRLWELATGKELKRIQWAGKSEVRHVSFSPDGTKLLAGGRGGGDTWRIYEVATCEALALPGATGKGRAWGFHPDGRSVIVRETRRWDYERAREVWSVPGRYTCLSSDGSRFITDSKEGLVLWNGRSGKEIAKFGFGSIGATFSPDGRRIVFTSAAGPVVYDTETCKELWKAAVKKPCSGGFSPDGRTILFVGVVGKDRFRAFLFDTEGRRRVVSFPIAIPSSANDWQARLLSKGKCAMFAGRSGRDRMEFYSTKTGKLVYKRHYRSGPYCEVDERHLLVSSDKVDTPNVFSLYGLR